MCGVGRRSVGGVRGGSPGDSLRGVRGWVGVVVDCVPGWGAHRRTLGGVLDAELVIVRCVSVEMHGVLAVGCVGGERDGSPVV